MDYHQARAKAETNKVDSRHHNYPATASTATTSQIEHYKQARERMINCANPMREIQLLFPNERDQLDFREWMRDEAQKEHAARHPPVFEKEDLIRQVASGNFLDQGFLDGFIRMMRADRLPVLVVGNDAEGYYRLDVQAAARGLQPANTRSLTGLLPLYMLSVDGMDNFTFFQLGRLEYGLKAQTGGGKDLVSGRHVTDSMEKRWMDKAVTGWKNTGFWVVARVEPDGKANGIYAIWNNDPEDDDENLPLEPPGNCPKPCVLDVSDVFAFRLGRHLSDMGPNNCVDWAENVVVRGLRDLHPVRRDSLLRSAE